jgi:hypothetical protein
MPRVWTQEEIDAEMEAYAEAEALDAIRSGKGVQTTGSLIPKSKPARRRHRQVATLKSPK